MARLKIKVCPTRLITLLVIILIVAVCMVNAQLTNTITIQNTGQISTTKIWAKSGYWRDIQTAVDIVAALGGGLVYIPEGTWNFVNIGESWSSARVIVPAGVSIFGAPTERDGNGQVVVWKTVLVMPWDMPGSDSTIWFRIGSEGAAVQKFTQFSDIKLIGYRYFNVSSTHMHRAVRLTCILDFRIDHCCFQDITAGIAVTGDSNLGQQETHYMIRGVIDHCIFNNTYGRVAPYDSRTVDYGVQVSRGGGWDFAYWELDFTKVLGQYTNYTVVIEDCYFSKWRHCVAVCNGAHAVVRNCEIRYDYAYGSLDIHGSNGGRAIEIYNCTITDAVSGGQVYATFIRGGAGVAFGNTVGGGVYTYFIYFSNEHSDPTYWIHDWYIWDNRMVEGCNLLTKYDPTNDINENEDYFLYAPSWYTPYPYPHPLTLR
jgi:hypothetical protein